MNMKKLFGAGIVAGALAYSSVAGAAVTFDAATGTGFVGKGDVQLALELNNSQLQAQASSLVFTYDAVETYEAVCQFTTENKQGSTVHTPTRTKTSDVNASVEYDARTRKQITGFNLTGLAGATVSGDAVPLVGESCPGGNVGDGRWISVTLASTEGGLFVNGALLTIA